MRVAAPGRPWWPGRERNRLTGLGVVAAAISLMVAVGCAPEPRPDGPVRIVTTVSGEQTRLTLVPASTIKLNARIKPALELPDGSILRFDSPRLTSDSAYFAEPPSATLSGRRRHVRGTLRASICENDAPVCRALVMEL